MERYEHALAELARFEEREQPSGSSNDYGWGVLFGKWRDRVERIGGEVVPFDEPALIRRFLQSPELP